MRRVFITLLFSVLLTANAHLDHSHFEIGDDLGHSFGAHFAEATEGDDTASLETYSSGEIAELCQGGLENDECSEYILESHDSQLPSSAQDLSEISDVGSTEEDLEDADLTLPQEDSNIPTHQTSHNSDYEPATPSHPKPVTQPQPTSDENLKTNRDPIIAETTSFGKETASSKNKPVNEPKDKPRTRVEFQDRDKEASNYGKNQETTKTKRGAFSTDSTVINAGKAIENPTEKVSNAYENASKYELGYLYEDEYPKYLEVLVNFAISTESYLATGYSYVRERKPYNFIAFYLLVIYLLFKLLVGSSRKSQVSFSYKVVDERAQDAIMQTIGQKFEEIEKKLAELKEVKPVVQNVVQPSRPASNPNIPDLQPKLDQITANLNKLLQWQEEFQTEIVDSHKQIWEELHNIYNMRSDSLPANQLGECHTTPQLHAPRDLEPQVDLHQHVPEVTSQVSQHISKPSSEQVSNVSTPSIKPLSVSNPPLESELLSETAPKEAFEVSQDEIRPSLDDSVLSDRKAESVEEKPEVRDEPILLAEPPVRPPEVVDVKRIPPVRFVGNPGRGRGVVPMPKRKEPEGSIEEGPGRAKFVAPANISTNPFGFKA
jgi:hypothetical protein